MLREVKRGQKENPRRGGRGFEISGMGETQAVQACDPLPGRSRVIVDPPGVPDSE